MADVHNRVTRSYNMSRIRARDTGPEMEVRKFLHGNGLRYRLYNNRLPGKPDLTLNKYHTVIFVNGCFWHGHKGCKYFVMPKTRTKWWQKKIHKTVLRDKEIIGNLKDSGWNVIIIWGCELKPGKREKTLNKLLTHITKGDFK